MKRDLKEFRIGANKLERHEQSSESSGELAWIAEIKQAWAEALSVATTIMLE